MTKMDKVRPEEIPENLREAVEIVAGALARKWKIPLDKQRDTRLYSSAKEATTP